MAEFFTSAAGGLGILYFILGLSFLIFIHELGHFAVAKWCGIRVEKFAVGLDLFKLKLFSYTHGETTYVLGAIPLGGYVKMLGQDDLDPTKVSDDPRSYNNKTYSQRMAVISAGVIMNMIFGAIFFIISFMMGVSFPSNVVGSVNPDYPAATTAAANKPGVVGLEPGDKVVEINGKKIDDWGDIRIASALSGNDTTLNVKVLRPNDDGTTEELIFPMKPKVNPDQENLKLLGIQNISTIKSIDEASLSRFPEDEQVLYRKFLNDNGMRTGMTISKINGEPVKADEPWMYYRKVQEFGTDPITLTFADDQGEVDLPVKALAAFQYEIIAHNYKDDVRRVAIPHILGLSMPIRVGGVAPGMENGSENLKENDLVIRVGDYRYPTHSDILETAIKHDGNPIEIEVQRETDGNVETLTYTVTPKDGLLGVVISYEESNIISGITKNSPLYQLENKPSIGARVLKINDTDIETIRDIQAPILSSENNTFNLTYEETIGDEKVVKTIPVTITDEQRQSLEWVIPIYKDGQFHMPLFQERMVTVQTSNPLTAMQLGVEKTYEMVVLTYLSLVRLVDGSVPVTSLRGLPRMATSGAVMADRGFAYFLFFMAIISINLAVINFLPLPVLDGGHAVLLTIEKLSGKPVPLKVQSAINLVGLILIGSFFLFVNANDVFQMIQGNLM